MAAVKRGFDSPCPCLCHSPPYFLPPLIFSPHLPLPHPGPHRPPRPPHSPFTPVTRAGLAGGVRVDARLLSAAPLRRPAARRAARAASGGLYGAHGGQGARRGAGGGGGGAPLDGALPVLRMLPPAALGGWVRGDDASNLPLTRVAQSHIWKHQFPPSCDHRRLLLVDWPQLDADVAAGRQGDAERADSMGGMAGEVHVVGGLLGLAVLLNRTLVVTPGSFPHANHSACSATPESLACFFAPIAGPLCEQAAAHAMAAHPPVPALACASSATAQGAAAQGAAQGASQGLDELEALLTSADLVVRVCTGALSRHQLLLLANESRVATQWGAAVSEASQSVEVAGVVPPHDAHREQLHWWRSQAVRFLFRWPSAHLCHVTNLIRHISYGRYIAAQMHSAAQQQAAIIRSLAAGPSEADKSIGIDTAAEAKFLASVDIRSGPSLEGRVWPALGFEGCVKTKEGAWGGSVIIDEVYEGVGREAYIMRPVVSVHVSMGGSGGATGNSGGADPNTTLPAASPPQPDPLCRYVPTLLPAELLLPACDPHSTHGPLFMLPDMVHSYFTCVCMQEVSSELSEHHDWTFHSAVGSMDAHDGQSPPSGLEGSLGSAMGGTASMLSQLLIASECDYFVGALSSSSAQLLNELRSTNGRLLSGFISLDQL
ncbi:unnamed protein product [Closterium sp. Naga37s-1]|nr:unnamed protein product [Closterium sp. Naga37s-1]